jgi:predicted dehydrogenase
MDVGTYCVSAIRFYYGMEPVRCEFGYRPAGDGYDGSGAGLLVFPEGETATFSSGVHVNQQNKVRIYGTDGHIEIESPWFCSGRVWVRRNGEDEVIHGPWEVSDLYANEADTCARYLNEGEVPMMTIQDSLDNMRVLDALRASGGLSFD